MTQCILEIFRKFYAELYTSKNTVREGIDAFFGEHSLSKLKEDHKYILEKKFTLDELMESIKALKVNKSPGPDSYTAKYYKKFVPVLLLHLTMVCNQIRATGFLPPS